MPMANMIGMRYQNASGNPPSAAGRKMKSAHARIIKNRPGNTSSFFVYSLHSLKLNRRI